MKGVFSVITFLPSVKTFYSVVESSGERTFSEEFCSRSVAAYSFLEGKSCNKITVYSML